jgi:YD repeat-containing protein
MGVSNAGTWLKHRATHNWQPGKGMKTAVGALLLFVLTVGAAQAQSQDENLWFALDAPTYPPTDDLTHYPTADAACRVAYADDVVRFTSDVSFVRPYPGATWYAGFGVPAYECSFTVNIGGTDFGVDHIVLVVGDKCPDGQTFDAIVGRCALPGEQQNRRQEGDPDDEANNDPHDCQGDPINPAIGNQFEEVVDYRDVDGELRFVRFYNSTQGKWRHSYGASLIITPSAVALTFEDGRSSVFSVVGNVATAEPTERGTLVNSGGNWVYSSPDRQTLTFNTQGQLTAWTSPAGLTQKLTYGYDSTFTNQLVTVTDSRGHTLSFAEDFTGLLVSLAAPGVGATYTTNDGGLLTSASRTMQGKTTSQSYLYEDANNPAHLTGVVDERGIRAATWTYDAQGRATSSTRNGGIEKTTVGYSDDGTTTVTNALGHVVTYKYALVAGANRMTTVTGEPAPGCPIANSSFTYDARGQIATHTDALGRVTAYTYDTQGRMTAKTEARGMALERTTTTTWDGVSFRPKTVTTPDRVVTYTYDAKGRLLSTQTHPVKE